VAKRLQKIGFMLNKFRRDIVKKSPPFTMSTDLFSHKLGEFYFLFEDDPKRLNRLISGFDEKGIPVNRAYIDVESPRFHYYPISIGQYALARFNRFIHSGDPAVSEHFLRIADWFIEQAERDETGVFWLTDIPKPEYRVTKPWKSAFTQSRALSVLLRAWQLTSHEKYLALIPGILDLFFVDIRDGGVVADLYEGLPFYEEYVAAKPTRVLDGHNFSLLGLFDAYRALPEDLFHADKIRAKDAFDAGIQTLIKRLPDYDMGYWIRFNLCDLDHYPRTDPCSVGYYRLILSQLQLLENLSGRRELKTYREQFLHYDRMDYIIRMYGDKVKALKKLGRI